MSNSKRETYDKLAAYSKYVTGNYKFPKGKLQDCTQVFKDYGWTVCVPYDKTKLNVEKLGNISKFLNKYDGFVTEANDISDLYTLYKNDARG